MANRKQDNWILVGLGNPGKEYERTWHNIGAMFVEHIMSPYGPDWHKERDFRYLTCEKDQTLPEGTILVIPASYMNESGPAVRSALKKFNLTKNHLIIAHDDSDLPLGEVRLEFDRGSAGHNGVRSVIFTLGGQDFWRLRFGIRKENQAQRVPAGDFVLSVIKPQDYGAVEEAFTAGVNAAAKLIEKA